MKALKGNKEYIIDETQKKAYVEAGFDIKDDDGKVIAYGRGKTIPYADYAALQEANKKLKEENEAMRAHIAELTADKAEPETKAGKK